MRSRSRRGVLLLVVLGLLAMFGMVALAFVVIANSERTTTVIAARSNISFEQGQNHLQDGLNVAIRGTPTMFINNDPKQPAASSAIGSHSLLEGIFGNTDTYQGAIPDVPIWVMNKAGSPGQMIEFTVPDAWHKVGCVLTMTGTSPCTGLSTRIVSIDPAPDALNPQNASAAPKAQILPFENGLLPNKGDTFVVNGYPYVGAGYGFNPSSGSLDLPDNTFTNSSGLPASLAPNCPANCDPLGGANGDYTAPDLQTPLLGMQVPIANNNGMKQIYTPLPSLHRPELIAYWANQLKQDPINLQNWDVKTKPVLLSVMRSIMFRPNPIDHPNFTGSNPNFNPSWDGISTGPGPVPYQWDVDNSGFGRPDSVWVDLGMPVRTTADGRKYKPLYAILCLDLDGRLNVNAHGNISQLDTSLYISPTGGTYGVSASEVPTPGPPALFTGAQPPPLPPQAPQSGPLPLPRGLGFGPPEVNLLPIFPQARFASYQPLLVGKAGINGRYGEVASAPTPLPGFTNPGFTVAPLTYNKWWDYSGSYWGLIASSPLTWYDSSSNFLTDGYQTPPDPQGYQAIGLDVAGRPVFCTAGGPLVPAIKYESLFNTPYDLNLGRNAAYGSSITSATGPYGVADTPFSVAELERILRPFDRDTHYMPTRLAMLTSTAANGDPSYSELIPERYAVTTHSYAVPTPSPAPPATLLQGTSFLQTPIGKGGFVNNRPRNISDLLYAALLAGGSSQGAIPAQLAQMLPPEVIAGGKLNINRPMSNPPANRNKPVAGFELYTKPANAPPGINDDGLFNLNPTGGTDPTLGPLTPMQAKQLLARYLFVMAMLVRTPNSDMAYYTESDPTTVGTAASPGTQREFLNVRRIAQWAINVACFGSSDSTMVPFKYNVTPFTAAGWTAPLFDTDPAAGVAMHTIASNELSSPWLDATNKTSPTGVVWGCNSPECLITETAAWQNRRVADSKDDNKSHMSRTDTKTVASPTDPTKNWTVPGDIDLDQVRTPQGSLFFELFCPRSPFQGEAPTDLYVYDKNRSMWCLNLDKYVTDNTTKVSYPVWRAVITESTIQKPSDDILNRIDPTKPGSHPDTFNFETDQFNSSPGNPSKATFTSSLLPTSPDPNITIERIIWFTKDVKPIPGTTLDANRIFYNRAVDLNWSLVNDSTKDPTWIPCDQYAVVGPRPTTFVSSTHGGATPWASGNERIDFLAPVGVGSPATVAFTTTSGTLTVKTADVKQMLGIVVAAGGTGTSWPTGWTNLSSTAKYGIGLSVSEPLFSGVDANNVAEYYYPEPTQKGADNVVEWYDNPSSANNNTFLDRPLEPNPARMTLPGWLPDPNDSDPNKNSRPLVKESNISGRNLLQTGTIPRYKYILLQRLANPSVAFDPVVNPYRTVDFMPIDLTVYNGDDKPPAPAGKWAPPGTPPTAEVGNNTWAGPWDPDDPNDDDPTLTYFQARQRGKTLNPIPSRPASLGDTHYFGGIANNIWAQTSDDPAAPFVRSVAGSDSNANFNCDLGNTLGFVNQPYWDPGHADTFVHASDGYPAYLGDSWQPNPWLTWNGRPYISELELMMVPASHPGRLLWEFNFIPPGASGPPSPYTATGAQPWYPHLLNFFSSVSDPSASGAPTPAQTPSQMHRILEYIAVPSRFVGTDINADPNNAATGADKHWFHTPFNRIPLMREPGKINLNTITNYETFLGLMNNFPGLATGDTYNRFVESRLWPIVGNSSVVPNIGSDPNTGQMALAQYTGQLVQQSYSSYPTALTPPTQTTVFVPTRFMRPFRSPAAAAAAPGLNVEPNVGFSPQREVDAGLLRGDPTSSGRALFGYDPSTPYPVMESNRNAFFRYQSIQRLANLTTTRSNVFAIWITVGYFEVTRNPGANNGVDAGHPDGYQLGQELGADTGDTVRHRAFYIFDRSIPMGFIRGVDINNQKGLLLQRYIE